jgi:hypothetical protein
MVTSRRLRVAVLGGDGRFSPARLPECDLRLFKARRYGGNGELRRLEATLRSGTIDKLVILSKWNAHCVTDPIRKLCRRRGIPVEVL